MMHGSPSAGREMMTIPLRYPSGIRETCVFGSRVMRLMCVGPVLYDQSPSVKRPSVSGNRPIAF